MTLSQNSSFTGADNPENITAKPGKNLAKIQMLTNLAKIGKILAIFSAIFQQKIEL